MLGEFYDFCFSDQLPVPPTNTPCKCYGKHLKNLKINKSYLNTYDFIGNFELYLSISNLSNLFSNNLFLILFWIHFVSINLFVGGWMVRDSQKLVMNKILVAFPLIITYLIGPLGIFIYWLIRIFYAKSINLYE